MIKRLWVALNKSYLNGSVQSIVSLEAGRCCVRAFRQQTRDTVKTVAPDHDMKSSLTVLVVRFEVTAELSQGIDTLTKNNTHK